MPFIELLSVDSTNNYALTQVHAALTQHGAAFFAHEQVAGKGQRGKTWTAPKDSSVIVSIVVDPHPLQLSQQFQFNACIALSVCEFFSQYAGRETSIKWPNDLYWNDRKAGGILIENIIGSRRSGDGSQKSDVKSQKAEDEHIRIHQQPATGNRQPAISWLWAVAGIGININQAFFPAELRNPVSLKQITGKDFDPVALARDLCSRVDKNFNRLITKGFEDIYTSYISNLYMKDKIVKLKKNNRVFEAVVKSVSEAGELLVQHSVEEKYRFGEIEWITPTR
ncbi:MAG: biotin--[acetyl-CoA-carboxylase] ligase [Chitinophagaceae bacterium]